MNNVQLYLVVAIPSVLVILSWINNNTRQTGMEKRMDSFDTKIDRLEAKFENRIDALEAKFEKRVDALETKMDRRFDGVMDGIGSLRERLRWWSPSRGNRVTFSAGQAG